MSSDARVIFRFAVAGEHWNWPVDGQDGIDAFREILRRSRISFMEVTQTDERCETCGKPWGLCECEPRPDGKQAWIDRHMDAAKSRGRARATRSHLARLDALVGELAERLPADEFLEGWAERYGSTLEVLIGEHELLQALERFLEEIDAAPDEGPGSFGGRDATIRAGAIFASHAEALRGRAPAAARADFIDQEPVLPYAFLQWKGTDVCFDFHCACGADLHFDGYFAYNVECGQCHAVWEMPCFLHPRRAAEGSAPLQLLKAEEPMEEERAVVSLDDALEMLEIIDDYDAGPEQCVHTYVQGPAGMVVGAHWSLEKVKAEIAEHGIELSGPIMTTMSHGLVVGAEIKPVFLATKKAAA